MKSSFDNSQENNVQQSLLFCINFDSHLTKETWIPNNFVGAAICCTHFKIITKSVWHYFFSWDSFCDESLNYEIDYVLVCTHHFDTTGLINLMKIYCFSCRNFYWNLDTCKKDITTVHLLFTLVISFSLFQYV